MSGTAGVEIGADLVRVVVRPRRGDVRTYELAWDRDRVDDVVAELAATAGDVSGIGIAFGLAHLHIKQVTLPPASQQLRRQMIVVEPERWFTVPQGAQTAVSLTANGELAMAADGALVDEWVRAISAWGPVRRVDAAPIAVVRALCAGGKRTTRVSIAAGADEVGMVEIADGVLRSVRRARSGDFDPPASTTIAAGLDPRFNAAYGASLDFDGSVTEMLLTSAVERQFLSAERRRVVTWGVAAAAAIFAATWSAGVARDRALEAIGQAVSVARTQSQRATAFASSALTIDRELAAVTMTTASRANVPVTFAALGARLPAEAVAQRVRMVGTEWQVEGNARTAARVLAALAAEPSFVNVRFLAPSNRFRDGKIERETFSIAFSIR